MELTLVHLYPDLLNIYGDQGNVIALKYRAEARGIKFKIKPVSVGNKLTPGSFDLVFGGGGQDQQQLTVSQDLLSKASTLKQAARAGAPMLAICGTYQLFGNYFKTSAGASIKGIGIFNMSTIGAGKRKIGNIIINSAFGQLVGFENHSGNTFLQDKSQALGNVVLGFGNNGEDKTEGCRVNNAIGCYLHGSLLPKNPALADFMLQTALEKKYGKKIKLKPLNDKLETLAHDAAVARSKKLSSPLLKWW
jgi:CobQ-like glutamine amidotransferase family enzyme